VAKVLGGAPPGQLRRSAKYWLWCLPRLEQLEATTPKRLGRDGLKLRYRIFSTLMTRRGPDDLRNPSGEPRD